jgi:arylsulfatase A-like enzyme/Flp pilus assembly protein TadD
MENKSKERLFFLLFILIGVMLTCGLTLNSDTKGKDWNVLLISIDTIRPDRLSCYSTRYLQTRHIDALASKGIVFERAFAHNPTTLPSHVNIMLGTTPLHHGVHDNSNFKLGDNFLTLAEYLKEIGYSTGAFIGAFPLDSRFGLSQGFDVYDESYPSEPTTAFSAPERKAEDVIKVAIEWLGTQRSKWFSWIHLWDPHTMYSPPEPFLTEFKDDPYSGEVAYIDSELGKLFDFLENKDFLQNTLIVITGDHGESLGEHGELTHSYFAYNSTIWVPLIIAAPGLKSGRIPDYVCHADIFPTVCDILQADKPPFLQGTSLVPLMRGKEIQKRAIYFESLSPYYNRGAAPLRGFIEGGEKFYDTPLAEFYNLETDFDEENNLIQETNVEEYQKKLKTLMERLSSFQGEKIPSKLDREAMEKLRSLGYISSSYSKTRENYGSGDDVKTLLPFQQKLDKAIFLFDEGKIDESIRLLNEIITKKKDMAQAYLNLFLIYNSQGQHGKSLELLEEGFKNNPENYDIALAYGMLLIGAGQLDKSIEVLQKGLTLIDFDPKLWDYLGVVCWRKGEEQKALEHYRKALALDATYAMAYSNLGALYFSKFSRTGDRADYAQSMEYLKKAIEHDPNLAIAYRGLGMGYRVVGRVEDAITIWEKALELNPEDDFVLLNLGKAHLEKDEKTLALKYFEQYLRLRKDSLSSEERREIEALIQKCKQK